MPATVHTLSEAGVQVFPDLNPTEVDIGSISIYSERSLWWSCTKGHVWQQKVVNYVNSSGCAYCAGRKVVKGENDLETTHPRLALEWISPAPSEDPDLTPSSVTAIQRRRAIWRCRKNSAHVWEAVVAERTREGQGTGCPICAGKKVLLGENDVATTHPYLIPLWDPVENKVPLTAVTAGSNKKMHWRCKEGHKWVTSVFEESTKKKNCSVCSGRKLVSGFNDLETLFPDVANEWHPSQNVSTPRQVLPGSSVKITWICAQQHTWVTSVRERTQNGSQCPHCQGRHLSGYNDLATLAPPFLEEWHPSKNLPLTPRDVTQGSAKRVWWKCKKGHEWLASCGDRLYGYGCGKCVSSLSSSKGEDELARFLQVDLGLHVERHDRTLIKPQEVDIFIPSKRVAIEFNGVFWHSELNGKGRHYHYDKWKACKEADIQLLQVWSDDWEEKTEVVKNMLRTKLNVPSSNARRTYARKTKVVDISTELADQLLEDNHIQGKARGSHRLGLIAQATSELVAVAVLQKKDLGGGRSQIEIVRYATKHAVVGGFSKILKFIENELTPDIIVTFSDNSISDGNLYRKTGFLAEKELAPDYSYSVSGKRKHKFGYRLKKFRNDPDLKWSEGMTEKELATLNQLYRVWDSGKVRWVKRLVIPKPMAE